MDLRGGGMEDRIRKFFVQVKNDATIFLLFLCLVVLVLFAIIGIPILSYLIRIGIISWII